MNDKQQLEEALKGLTSAQPSETKVETPAQTQVAEATLIVEENPLKVVLEKEKAKNPKSELERAEKALKHNAERYKQIGGDPAKALGIQIETTEDEVEDEKPLTRKELEEILSKNRTIQTVKSVQDLVSEKIADPVEKELYNFYAENRIKPSDDPQEDFRLIQGMVNSHKNSQILEQVNLKPQAKSHSSASGGGTVQSEPTITYTKEEQAYLNTGLITKEEILLAREGKPIPQK